MSLESGIYIIRSLDTFIGRNLAEDRSLRPKKVLRLPEGIQAPKWAVERLENGKYVIKANGAYTAKIDGLLFAILLEEPRPTEWAVTAVPNLGKDRYIVEDRDDGTGWVTPEEIHEQIAVKHLIVGPSDPPFYPPNEVFEFVRVDYD